MGFLAEFIIQSVKVILTAAVAVGGIFLGRYLRLRNNAKKAAVNNEEQ